MAPVGATAKIRTEEAAESRQTDCCRTHFGLAVTCLQTDGSQPVGRGIGPALEAHDVLAVLQNSEPLRICATVRPRSPERV